MDHMGITFPDPHALATFVREHHGPTRVFTSLGWMIRNLRVALDLGEASKPAPVRSTRLGQGQSQAAALEPGMVTHLLGVLECTAEHAHWPILLASAAMIFGLIRFCHLYNGATSSERTPQSCCSGVTKAKQAPVMGLPGLSHERWEPGPVCHLEAPFGPGSSSAW